MAPITRNWLLAGVALLASIGCDDSGRLPTYATSGVVNYQDGKPIEEGSIIFTAEGLPPGRGTIENGKFTLGTYEQADGVVAGKFRAALIVSPPIDYDPDAGSPPVGAKAKYRRPETSGLEFEVMPDVDNQFEITLERGK